MLAGARAQGGRQPSRRCCAAVLGPGGTAGGFGIGRPAAGKTGTTNDSKAAWFVGYTPQLSTAVWVGKSTPTPMRSVVINGRYYRQVYGGEHPGPDLAADDARRA